MNVLSLFGGIETGLVVLKELGVKIDNYYSSEIDKYASSIARFNHPEIIELGDISNYKDWDLPKIDLILAGPPCQGFSVAGRGLNWADPRSQLFFTAIEILWKYKPKYFLFENVASMKKEIRSEIDELMEVDHMMINSALVSAQNRKRNYWFNWDAKQPEDKGILLKDIIEGGHTGLYTDYIPNNVHVVGKINSSQDGVVVSEHGKAPVLTAGHGNCPKISTEKAARICGRRINSDGKRDDYNLDIKKKQKLEINENPDKTNCLSTVQKDNVLVTKENLSFRKLTVIEHILQGIL